MDAGTTAADAPEGTREVTAPGVPPRRREKAEDREQLGGRDAVELAGNKGKLSPEEVTSATEWLLEEDDGPVEPTYLEINVGGPANEDGTPVASNNPPRFIKWGIVPIGPEEIKSIRKSSQEGSRRQRQAGNTDVDEAKFGVKMIVAGTVDPDIKSIAHQQGLIDPGDVVRKRFGRKPGLIQQISGQIMDLSGYNDDDVREADAGKP